MERVEEVTLENLFTISKDIIKTYCLENDIEDEKEIHPATWCDILDEINSALLSDGSRLLKTETNKYNQYDIERVIYLYNKVYVKLCNIYIQEINQRDFLILSGIDKQSLYNWSGNNKLSATSFDFIEKINEDNEASVWNLMRGDKGNPNKYFGKLNRYHGWNGAGTISEKNTRQSLTAAELPKLGGNHTQLQLESKSEVIDEHTQL